jgi:hypothetical protein
MLREIQSITLGGVCIYIGYIDRYDMAVLLHFLLKYFLVFWACWRIQEEMALNCEQICYFVVLVGYPWPRSAMSCIVSDPSSSLKYIVGNFVVKVGEPRGLLSLRSSIGE